MLVFICSLIPSLTLFLQKFKQIYKMLFIFQEIKYIQHLNI